MKKIIIVLSIICFCFTGTLYATLEADKDFILNQFDYVPESAEVPVLLALYSDGLKAYADRKYKDAEFFFTKILEIKKTYKQAKFLLEAMKRMQKHSPFDAKEIIIDEYYNEGQDLYSRGSYLKAINIWEKLLVLKPLKAKMIEGSIFDARKVLAEPHYDKGWDFYRKENYDKAIEEWEEALALYPTYHGLKNLLEKTREKSRTISVGKLVKDARELYNKKKYFSSLTIINKALKINAKYPLAVSLKEKIKNKINSIYLSNFTEGIKQFKREKYTGAIKKFKVALKYALKARERRQAEEYMRKARYNLALLVRSKKKGGIKDFDIEEVEEPKREVDTEEVRKHYNQGLYYYKNGYLAKAIAEWEIVLNLDPENERAYTSIQKAKAALKERER